MSANRCRSRAMSMRWRPATTKAAGASSDEFGIANLDRLGEHIIETSRQATLDAIRQLKPGKYQNAVHMDGSMRPGALLTLQLRVASVDAGRCAPMPGAIVDIWHCDAAGAYSDATDAAFST